MVGASPHQKPFALSTLIDELKPSNRRLRVGTQCLNFLLALLNCSQQNLVQKARPHAE
jgi:hypothetical protein